MKKTLYKIAVMTRLILFWRLAKKIKEKGALYFIHLLVMQIEKTPMVIKFRRTQLRRILTKIAEEKLYKGVIISLSFIDWNVPLFQRPQHIARQLGKQGFLYFYHTRNYYDTVRGCQQVNENVFLIDDVDTVMEFFSEKPKLVHVYSTNMYPEDDARINKALHRGDKVLYEYIDEISEYIAGHKIPAFVYSRHEKLLKNQKQVYVVATATTLFKEVLKYRTENASLITNGVSFEDFQGESEIPPKEIASLVAVAKPIIGYYGAFAHWFDYELVKKTALDHPEWNFILIGWDYDGSLNKSRISRIPNITILGPIPYQRLPDYAKWFTVCTIPFLINDITKSTSPVKIFEYMALGKPIVTTSMPECKKYESVFISESNSASFGVEIKKALGVIANDEYLALLKKNALENTWSMKATSIVELITK